METLRSSATSQSVPTPRQSQRNTPSHRLIAAASSSGVSCWFLPSVSKMACRSVAGEEEKIWCASRSHCPIAVPPLARSWRSAALASARVRSPATAIDPSVG